MKIRENWEQRKLKDVMDYLPNNTLSRAELGKNGLAYSIHYGDVLINYGEILDLDIDHADMIMDFDIAHKLNAGKLENGDLIFADTAEDETVGKTSEIQNIKNRLVVSGLHTIPMRPKQMFAPGFLGYELNSFGFRDQLKPLMQGIKVTSISKSSLANVTIKFPIELSEQEQIVSVLKKLNKTITLHQRKYVLLIR